MHFETRDLQLVDAVIAEGTLTAAAGRLGITQSAASHQLARLERRLGTSVFHRSGHGMVVTTAGRRILRTARLVLDELRDLEEEVAAIADGRSGSLRITAQCYTGYHWLPPLLSEYRRSDPGVDVEIVPVAAADPVAAVLDGDVDVALAYDVPESERVVKIPLFEDDLVLLTSPRHPLANRKRVQAADFRDQHLLTYRREPAENLFLRRVLLPAGVTPRRVSEVRLTEGILALVAADVGVAVMTRWTAAPQIAAGAVTAIPVGKHGLRRPWRAILLRELADAPHVRRFLALLEAGPEGLYEGAEAGLRRAAGLAASPG